MNTAVANPVHTVPETSDYYRLRAMGRRACPEFYNELFVVVWKQADVVERDYRNLIKKWVVEAQKRRLNVDTSSSDVYRMYKSLWRNTVNESVDLEEAVHRYVDVFVAAILQCKIVGARVYE